MNEIYDLNKLHLISGLSEKEAAERLQREGFNEIPSAKKRSFFAIAFDVLREPMLLLLIAGGIIYLILGDIQEALLLLFFVCVIIGITLYQEHKTERTLEALRDLSSPRAMVIRDHATRRIAGREVVRGDIVVLSEGDRVPADGIVLACNNLMVEESLLTGESVPVHKLECADENMPMERPGGDQSPFIYSGTLVVSGLGIARIAATGIHTEFGRIGKSLQTIEHGRNAPPERNGALRPQYRPDCRGALCDNGGRLRSYHREMARWFSGEHHPGDGYPAGGVPRGAYGFPGHRRLAHLAKPGVDAPRGCY